jgi:hypothetical protein
LELKLTNEQYLTLLKTVTLSTWVTSIIAENEELDVSEFEELEQHIYSQFKNFEAASSIFYDSETESYFATQEIEDSIQPILEIYEEYSFWDELTHRLARRDFIQIEGEESILNMDPLDRMEREEEYLIKYSEEFSLNGLNRLNIQH